MNAFSRLKKCFPGRIPGNQNNFIQSLGHVFLYPHFIFRCMLVCTFPLIFSGCTSSPKSEGRPPNVILIIADDQGWGDLSFHGNTNIATPNIDRLASNGVSFEHFFVCPVCSPTRAELLTGRYHVRGGVYSTSAGGERLDLDETTIAEVFREAGYATAAYGKWHNGMQPPYHPNARGFNDFYGFCSGHWGNYFSPLLEHNGRLIRGKGFIIDDLTSHGMDFIEKNKNRPFFLYLPYNTPHGPMQVPDRWWNRFKNKKLEMLHRDPEKEDIPYTRAALAMCENIDWNVGRILKKVEETDLKEKTIILYLSDNGPNSWRWNGGMKGKKGHTDEGGVRSPLFICWEGTLEPGKKVRNIAGAIDLLPTLADLAGIPFAPEKPADGMSLKKFLVSDSPALAERYLINHWRNRTSVRSQKYRLDHENRLFDMEKDPGQTTDISGEHPAIKETLLREKAQWEKGVLKKLPGKAPRPFTIGAPGFAFTQLPARDGNAHGSIERSSRFPNCSFFTNWTSTRDSITWNTEVLSEGDYEVEIYYTCAPRDTGAVVELNFAGEKLSAEIQEPHNPPLTGSENDRTVRIESYVKDFKPLNMGILHLKKEKGILSLKATKIPGSQAMDFRLLMFEKI